MLVDWTIMALVGDRRATLDFLKLMLKAVLWLLVLSNLEWK